MPIVTAKRGWPPEGSKTSYITPNWCDRTTWYQAAVRVADELVLDVAGVRQVAHVPVVDTGHGKITGEDVLRDAVGNAYRVVVKVNGLQKVEKDPDTAVGDYSLDYATGVFTFAPPLLPVDVVLVTYHRVTVADYVLKPAATKILRIRSVEAQFSEDVVLKDTILFEILMGAAVVGAASYKTMMDFVNAANGVYPELRAMGGAGWRGLPRPILTFPWHYQSTTDLKASANMQLRIRLQNNIAFGGFCATATFYALVDDDL